MFVVKLDETVVFKVEGSEDAYIREMIILGLNYLLENEGWETVHLNGIVPETPGLAASAVVNKTFNREDLNNFVDFLEAK